MKKIFFITLVSSCCTNAFAFYAGGDNCVNTRIHFHYTGTIEKAFLPTDTVAPVKIELENTSFNDLAVLFISDTAKQMQDIGPVLSKGYGELMHWAQENRLRPKKFLAWYYSVQPPWIMDIAVETDKLPQELTGRIKSRTENGGEVLIAHMWGPYSELRQAYIQIENWLKQNNRLARSHSFEVYLNDPSAVRDPSEIRTDIYQPLQ